MVSVEAGNDLCLDPSTPLFQVVRNWLERNGNEIRLRYRKARRLHHHP